MPNMPKLETVKVEPSISFGCNFLSRDLPANSFKFLIKIRAHALYMPVHLVSVANQTHPTGVQSPS